MYQFRLSQISSNQDSTLSSLASALALCLALLGIASASILIVIAEREIGPNAITCNRLGIAAIAFALWNSLQLISNFRSDSSSELESIYTYGDAGLILIAGVSFAASLTLWAWSLTQTSVANSTLLNNMMPLFTTLGAWLLFRQQFSTKFLLGMTVAICGAFLIALEDFQVANNNIIGDAAALLAAMLSATSILSIEQLRVKFSTTVIMQWTSLAGSLFILLFVLLSEGQLLPTSWSGWSAIIALGLISQVLGQGLLTYSLKKFSSGLVAVSMLAIPIIAAILAMFIFSETLSLLNCLAFSVVLVGIYLAVSAKETSKKVSLELKK